MPISKIDRIKIWDHHIGLKYGEILCPDCNKIPINQLNFVKAHVIARANGGKFSINNLVPTCTICNECNGTDTVNVIDIKKNIIKNKRKAVDEMVYELNEYDKRQKIDSEIKNYDFTIYEKCAQICNMYKKYIIDDKDKIYRFNILVGIKASQYNVNHSISHLLKIMYNNIDNNNRRDFNDMKTDFKEALEYPNVYDILYDSINELI